MYMDILQSRVECSVSEFVIGLMEVVHASKKLFTCHTICHRFTFVFGSSRWKLLTIPFR